MNIDASKSAGVLLGTDIAQLICGALTYFWHIPVSGVIESSITGICIFIVAHLVPPTQQKANP
jgi:hypothetical protein